MDSDREVRFVLGSDLVYEPPSLRAGSTVRLNNELGCIELPDYAPFTPYEIDFDRCATPVDMMDWCFHMYEKNWITPTHLGDLVEAFYVVHGWRAVVAARRT